MWRTTGFLMSLAIVAELATVVSFLIIMAGGKMKRERGWKLLGVMLGVVAGIEFCAMGIVVGLRSGLGCWGLNCLANVGAWSRHIFTITTTCFLFRDISWIHRGIFAHLAGLLRYSVGLVSRFRRMCCRRRMDMSFYMIRLGYNGGSLFYQGGCILV